MGPAFYVVIKAMQRTSHLQGKGSFFISQSYQDPEHGPAPGIKPATSRSSGQAPFRLSSLLTSSPGRSSARAPQRAC